MKNVVIGFIGKRRRIAYFNNSLGVSKAICIHEKIWPEGDVLDSEGGKACKECCDNEFKEILSISQPPQTCCDTK